MKKFLWVGGAVLILLGAASYGFYKTHPNSSLYTNNLFGKIGTVIFANNAKENTTAYIVPLDENASRVYKLSDEDYSINNYVTKKLKAPKEARLNDAFSNYYLFQFACDEKHLTLDTCLAKKPDSFNFLSAGTSIFVKKDWLGRITFGVPNTDNPLYSKLILNNEGSSNETYAPDGVDFFTAAELQDLEDLWADNLEDSEADSNFTLDDEINLQSLRFGATFFGNITAKQLANTKTLPIRDPIFADYKAQGKALVAKQKAEKEEKERQLRLRQEKLARTPAFGNVGEAVKYSLNGEFYLRPLDGGLNQLYIISGDKYSQNYWRTIRLTNVSSWSEKIDKNNAYFILLDGCVKNNRPTSLSECIKSDQQPNLLLKGIDGHYANAPALTKLDLKKLASNPNSPVSVKDIFFNKWADLKEISRVSINDQDFLAYQARGNAINKQLELQREMSKPIYDLDPGDVYYLQGLFSDTPVSVVRIDAKSNTVKVRRHDDGTTSWVKYSDLLDRGQKQTNEVSRGVVGVAILACLLGGCDQ